MATLVAEEAEPEAEGLEPTADPIIERAEVTAEELGVTRRQFFNRAILGLFGGAFLGGLTISFLRVPVAEAREWLRDSDQRRQRRPAAPRDGTERRHVHTGLRLCGSDLDRSPFTRQEGLAGTSFEGLPVVAGNEGGEVALMALWQRCVHLGCRVPACNSSQGFECPCHGSKYNLHGEYEDGPAPRNLDRFAVEIDARGDLIVNTGEIFETPRAKVKTIDYPQGPNCV